MCRVIEKEIEGLSLRIGKLSKEIAGLPKGYISKKNIRGNVSFYLQWREGGKVLSKYLSRESVDDLEEKIRHRKELEEEVKSLIKEKRNLENFLIKTKVLFE